MKKRLLPMLLATAMAFSVAVPTLAADYSDVSAAAWYADAVADMTARGLMNGVGGNRFSPDGTFTRAQLATVLYRMAGSPAVTGKDSFTDTADDAWYAPAVLWAERNKVVNGIGNGQFGPERATTQEQLVTMLYRDAGEPESSAASDASNWAAAAVGWARNEGLVSGSELAFAPAADANRAQIAVIVSRYLQAKTQESPAAAAKKALVVYFSVADNDGIDAVSAATVVAHEGSDYGSAQLAAKFIGDYTGADVSAIVTEQSYPAEYNAMADSFIIITGGITMETQKVVFINKALNTRLAGLLRIPDGFDLSKNYPAIVVTGPMLSVKEQAQSVYAERLTEAGYVTLVFDGTYFGESEGTPRGQELPDVKESDIEGAVDYLCSLP